MEHLQDLAHHRCSLRLADGVVNKLGLPREAWVWILVPYFPSSVIFFFFFFSHLSFRRLSCKTRTALDLVEIWEVLHELIKWNAEHFPITCMKHGTYIIHFIVFFLIILSGFLDTICPQNSLAGLRSWDVPRAWPFFPHQAPSRMMSIQHAASPSSASGSCSHTICWLPPAAWAPWVSCLGLRGFKAARPSQWL